MSNLYWIRHVNVETNMFFAKQFYSFLFYKIRFIPASVRFLRNFLTDITGTQPLPCERYDTLNQPCVRGPPLCPPSSAKVQVAGSVQPGTGSSYLPQRYSTSSQLSPGSAIANCVITKYSHDKLSFTRLKFMQW